MMRFLHKAAAPGSSWSLAAGRLSWRCPYLWLRSGRGQDGSLEGSFLLVGAISSGHLLKSHSHNPESYLKLGKGISKICTLNRRWNTYSVDFPNKILAPFLERSCYFYLLVPGGDGGLFRWSFSGASVKSWVEIFHINSNRTNQMLLYLFLKALYFSITNSLSWFSK